MKLNLTNLYSVIRISSATGISLLIATLLVTGCSSDSNDANGFNLPNINTAAVEITSTNDTTVAATSLEGSNGKIVSGSGNPFGVEISDSNTAVSKNRLSFIKERVISSLGDATPSIITQSTPVGIAVNDSLPCDNNVGAIGISGNISSDTEFLSGDTFTLSFSNCLDAFDNTLSNGSMSLTFNKSITISTFATGNYDFDFSMTFDNFQVSERSGNKLFTLHGDMRLSQITTGSNITSTIKGTSIYMLEVGNDLLLTDYDINGSYDSTTNSEQVVATFTIASSELDGSIVVTSNINFNNGSTVPTSGTMTVTGANNTVLSVDISATISIDLTIDGVSQAGYPKTVTWSELDVELDKIT